MIEINGVREALANLSAVPPRFFRAPGRLTLMGEYVEHSQGFVLSIAIDRAAVVAAAPRADRVVRVLAADRATSAEFTLGDPASNPGGWIDDFDATARVLEQRGYTLTGADIAARTMLPSETALGSTASLLVASAQALLALAGRDISPDDLARACREARLESATHVIDGFDAFTILRGLRDRALLIDTRTSEVSDLPFLVPDVALMVCDPRVERNQTEALALERNGECAEAADMLRSVLPKVKTLRDVSLSDFLRHGERLPAHLHKRARYIVTENVRVLQAVAAVRAADPVAIGKLFDESHVALRDDYDIVPHALEVFGTAARSVEGVYGARMTGTALLALVRRDAIPAFRAALTAASRASVGRHVTIFEVRATDGAAEIV